MNVLYSYHNGNSVVKLLEDGTREIFTLEPSFDFDYPLNIDIRCSTKCSFGYNPKTGKSTCEFCHESSRTDGKECDYIALRQKLVGLPKGIELAVGCNELTGQMEAFLFWCTVNDYVVNLTINQGHLKKNHTALKSMINRGFVKGLGVSYRSSLLWDIRSDILEYPNTVFHVIAGIDDINDVLTLKDKGVKKILVLGEKDFGFNAGKVDLTTRCHKEWYWWVKKLFTEFDTVSFDNLALEQLNIKRFLTPEQWDEFNQGEYSFYINAVDRYFAPSSRSNEKTLWENITVKEYFKTLKNKNNGM